MTQLLRQDLRYTLRQLARSPGFAIVAVLTLGLGIGANTAIFSVVNAVLLRPLPYDDPSRLMMVRETRPEGTPGVVSFLNFADWREQSRDFEALSLFRGTRLNVAGRGEPERVAGALVTTDFFRVLRVTPVAGRRFAAGEDQAGSDAVVVLSHQLWQRRFGGDPRAIGQVVTVDGKPMTVIGVAPAGFDYPEQSQMWLPVSNDAADILENRGLHGYSVIGRLLPGVTVEQARVRMSALAARLAQQYPASNQGWGAMVTPLQEALVGDVRPTLLVLLGAVGFVLLIASANVANMMLARSAGRRREISIRTAMGASRSRLIRQLLTESLLIALLGGSVGLLLAVWGADALISLKPDDIPAAGGVVLDRAVLGFTLAVSVLTSVLFGLVPALHAARLDSGALLREAGRATGGSDRQRTRRLLVVTEIALSLLLLIGAGLMIRSFSRLQAVDPGFNPAGVLTARLSLPPTRYDSTQVVRFYDQLVEKVRALPGVSSAAAVSFVPLGPAGARYRFNVAGQPVVEPQQRPGADFYAVTPGYFSTLEIPLQAGRAMGPEDRFDTPAVVVINQTMAARHWPGQSALGKRITFGEPEENAWLEVIGVVADVKQRSLDTAVRPQVYAPEAQVGWEEMSLVIRTPADPWSLVPAVRQQVLALDRDQPVSDFETLGQIRSASISADRFRTLLLGGLALVALLLAAIGVYGVIAYGVAQRSREIGIRMALGARQAEILALVVREAMATVAVGIVAGVVAALALSSVLESLLYTVKPGDPPTFVVICVLVSAVALAACVLPARRATKVDPMLALRTE
ncbi:MAG: ABC transporter permease [Gemmatimonadales bacterium]|nr:ABC transporter permease [Gemmatimonadales bacterium]MDQ3427896.1 ABC transporter permease [Gemmatimonadota bacterium]